MTLSLLRSVYEFVRAESPRARMDLLSVQLCLQQQRITQRGSFSTYSFILLWRV